MTTRHAVLCFAVTAICLGPFALPRTPQPQSYHAMADERAGVGVPNALNVLSNLPFALVGLLGLKAVWSRNGRARFLDPWERWPYSAIFAGSALTTVGSAYYHLGPDNARLVWDRLPMTIAFMGLLTAVITERIGVAVGRRAFAALLAIGMGSVAWWYWSELRHSGDLRPYLVVQFGSVAVIALLLWLYPPRYSGGAYLVTTLGLYGAAKALESADGQVFRVTGFVSGHTLKHLVAALAGAALIVMLQVREDATPTGPDMEAML